MNQVDFIVFIWSYLVFKTDFTRREIVQSNSSKEFIRTKSRQWSKEILLPQWGGIEELCTCGNISV